MADTNYRKMTPAEFVENVQVVEGSNIRLDPSKIKKFADKKIVGLGKLFAPIHIRKATDEDKAAGITSPFVINDVYGHRCHAALTYLVENDLADNFDDITVEEVPGGTRTNGLVDMLANGLLTPVDEANGFTQLKEEGHSTEEIAKMVGKTGQFVRDRIRLGKASEELREASVEIAKGGIGTSMAVRIARAHPEDHEKQKELVERAKQGPEERHIILEELNMDGNKKRREQEAQTESGEKEGESQVKARLIEVVKEIASAQKIRRCPPELKEIDLKQPDDQVRTDVLDQLADSSSGYRVVFAWGKAVGALEALVGEENAKTKNIWDFA